ncbi:MAG: hypothetical protein JNL08_01405 [Planctomycetes bacterium]|nr:hypothetical protein [Planctomycetota bacterium]
MTALSLGVAGLVWSTLGGAAGAPVRVEPVGDGDPAPVWRDQAAFAVDAVTGVRPRRACVVQITLATFGEAAATVRTKHRDADGFLRRDAVAQPADRPLVLLLGDSHLDGVVDTEANAGALLERRLAAAAAPCYVQNAACGHHGPWQYALRARELVPRLRPAVVVVVVFLGNDLLDLDQPLLPHLDDLLREQPPREPTDAAAMLARLQRLALPTADAQLFWQGLNQAETARERPARATIWLAKARAAVAAIEAVAAAHGARVVWALLPSFDLLFPERVQALGEAAAAVVASGVQRQLAGGFADALRAAGGTALDLEPALRRDGRPALFAVDYHIDRAAHELLAQELAEPVRAALTR